VDRADDLAPGSYDHAMSVDGFRPRRWVEELPGRWWVLLHAAFYLVLSGAALALTSPDSLGGMLWALAWGWPVLGLMTAAFGTCLGLLRVLADLPWPWYRLLSLLFFVAPLGVVVPAGTPVKEAAVAVAVQVIMALVVVQPHRSWAMADPTPDDHHW
jgi:hypothetical protein